MASNRLKPQFEKVQRQYPFNRDSLIGMLRAGKSASLFVSQATKGKRHATFYSVNSGPLKPKLNTVARVKLSSDEN